MEDRLARLEADVRYLRKLCLGAVSIACVAAVLAALVVAWVTWFNFMGVHAFIDVLNRAAAAQEEANQRIESSPRTLQERP